MASTIEAEDFPRRLRGVTLALTVMAASPVAMHGDLANAAGLASMPTLDGGPPLAIARHDPQFAVSTDVAVRPEFAARSRVHWLVDGEKPTGRFAYGFTPAEIKALGAAVTDPERPRQNSGRFRIVTLQQIIDFAEAQRAKPGRVGPAR